MKKKLELLIQNDEKSVNVEVKVSFLVHDNKEVYCRTSNKERTI